MPKKKESKKKAKKTSKKKKEEKMEEVVEESVEEVEQEAPEMKEEEMPEEKEGEKAPEKEMKKSAVYEESKSEKRMRLSILLLSMVCVLLWGALIYLLNQTYIINDNYAELIQKVDTLTTLYHGDAEEEDVEEVDEDMDEEDAADDDMDDSTEEGDMEDSDEVTLMEETFECDHPYSGGDVPTGSMTIRYPEGVVLEDVSLPENPLACMLELSYMTGKLFFKYSNGEAYLEQHDPGFVVLKTEGDQIMGRDPLTYMDDSGSMYGEEGYRTSYAMKEADDTICTDPNNLGGAMEPPCGISGNQFVTLLGSSYVFIEAGTSEADREEIMEMFDIVNVESEGGPYEE